MFKGERVVPNHRRRVGLRELQCGPVLVRPDDIVVDVPRDVEVEGLVHALFEVGNVRLGAVVIRGEVGAVGVASPGQIVEAVGKPKVKGIGAVVGITIPPPQHVRCNVEVFDAAVAGRRTVDAWVAGSGDKGTTVGQLLLVVSVVCYVDDRLNIQVARGAAIGPGIKFAMGCVWRQCHLGQVSGGVWTRIEQRGWRRPLRCNSVSISIRTGAK